MAIDSLGSCYEYVRNPPHYAVLTPEEVKRLAEKGEGVDVCAIAEKTGLVKDAYMFMVLKYVLRRGKPNEPRSRDVAKIREYSEKWLKMDGDGGHGVQA